MKLFKFPSMIYQLFILQTERLSLKRWLGGCGHGFSGCDGLGGLGGFDGIGGFGGFRGFNGFSGFSGFDGYPTLSLKGFSVSFTLLLKVLYLLVSYPQSYTWLKLERQISISKERFIRSYLHYGVLGDCVFQFFVLMYIIIYK